MVYHTSRAAIVLAQGDAEYTIPRQFSTRAAECSLLEYVLDAVWTVADELYVVFDHDPDLRLVEAIAPFGVKIVVSQGRSDHVANMAAGFRASKAELCLVTPDNVPFLKPNVVFALFDAARGFDAAIPRWKDGRIEPLLGVYRRKAFLRAAAQNPKAGHAASVLDNLYAVRFVRVEDELQQLDPELHSFFRVQTRNDLARARRLATLRAKRSHPR